MEPTDDNTSKKFFAIENIVKGFFTTILGLCGIAAAGYGWYVDHLTDWQGIGLGVSSFMLAFMRDQLPAFISRWVTKKIDDGKTEKP